MADSASPMSNVASVEPRSRETTAYEWSRPKAGVGEKRTRTACGPSTETAAMPRAFLNTSDEPSRVGRDIPPRSVQPASTRWGTARTAERARTAKGLSMPQAT